MLRRGTASLCALALVLGGCLGGDEQPASQGRHGTLTVYASLPRHGLSADEAVAVEAGARLALREAGGRTGGRAIRLVRLDSSKAPGEPWDPGQVQANAERARDDPSAIAYIGELGLGASAVSVPVTNEAGMLQVSPLESLTSLTRAPPGRAGRGAPERYYPEGRHTFVRLVPNDLREAELITARVADLGAERPAIVKGEGVYAEELAAQLAQRLRGAGRAPIDGADLSDDPESARSIVAELVADRPDAIAYAGLGGRPAERFLAALAHSLPATPVLAGGGILARAPFRFGEAPRQVEAYGRVRPAAGYGRSAGRILERVSRAYGAAASRPEALYGYEAAQVILDAVRSGGSDRPAVVRAAFGARPRRSPIGSYQVLPSGDVAGPPMTLYRMENGAFEPVTEPG